MMVCNVVVVTGSHNKQSRSRSVGDYLAGRCRNRGWVAKVIDLAELNLPFVDDDFKAKGKEVFVQTARDLEVATALVIVSPEWSGMATPALKNFFLACPPELLGHKPALLVGVSAGTGGAYPIAELRASSYKNTHLCYLPDHLIVRGPENYLSGEAPIDGADSTLRDRAEYTLDLLGAYSAALNTVRASGIVSYERFAYGM